MTADLVDALSGFQGVTLRVRHPLKPASMRLLDTLGATVIVDPDAPPCTRFAGKHNDRISKRLCPECADVAALPRTAQVNA